MIHETIRGVRFTFKPYTRGLSPVFNRPNIGYSIHCEACDKTWRVNEPRRVAYAEANQHARRIHAGFTDVEASACAVIAEAGGRIRPREFAKAFWPESTGHGKTYKVGRGATKGAALWRSAGAYLGRLANAGLVRLDDKTDAYMLTPAGRKAAKRHAD